MNESTFLPLGELTEGNIFRHPAHPDLPNFGLLHKVILTDVDQYSVQQCETGLELDTSKRPLQMLPTTTLGWLVKYVDEHS